MKFRKITALLLVLCMMLSLSISAFAADDVVASGTIQNSGIRWELNGNGWLTISGSDVEETKITKAERAMGVTVYLEHDAAHLGDAQLVVYSAAIHDENPELKAARARGIPAVERSVMLGYVSRMYSHSVCVSGTHGKTTTDRKSVV